MRERDPRNEIECGVLQIMFSVTLHYAKDGESPQQVQAEDTLAVYLNAQEVAHLFDHFGYKRLAVDLENQ